MVLTGDQVLTTSALVIRAFCYGTILGYGEFIDYNLLQNVIKFLLSRRMENKIFSLLKLGFSKLFIRSCYDLLTCNGNYTLEFSLKFSFVKIRFF